MTIELGLNYWPIYYLVILRRRKFIHDCRFLVVGERETDL
uniref:Uncharacterized protein n=1 Tax=Tetranychus urticae TaxID=32264 RepID=T1JUG3_TETUR